MDTDPAPSKARARLLPIYMMVMLFTPTIFTYFTLWRSGPGVRGFPFEVLAWMYVVLLTGLFVVLLLTPSTSKELDKIVDTEASTVTLGMTLYGSWFYSAFQEGFGAPELHPMMVVGFIIVVYVISKLVLRLKYR